MFSQYRLSNVPLVISFNKFITFCPCSLGASLKLQDKFLFRARFFIQLEDGAWFNKTVGKFMNRHIHTKESHIVHSKK